MKTNTSVLRIAKNLGSVGLVFTVSKASALKSEMTAQSQAQVDAEIKSLSSSVQQALSQSGSEALADSEIQNMIQSQVENMVAEQAQSESKAVSTSIPFNQEPGQFFTISTPNES